ncbi:MAG: cupin domain-containing protein [Desulfovibrio sp.]|nr:cupin domain-containing protein [Desulfovibrio sp.]
MLKSLLTALALGALLAVFPVSGQAQEAYTVIQNGDIPSHAVRREHFFRPTEDAPYGVSLVTFDPGARTCWHTHPLGQRLIVTQGSGLTGTADGKVWEIKAGDVVWCPAGVKHWHGASPTTAMQHLAIHGMKDGKMVDWMEEVTDEQYAGKN